MSEKRRALGRGLGALIPNAPANATSRPVDVFFPDQRPGADDQAAAGAAAAGADAESSGTDGSGTQDGSPAAPTSEAPTTEADTPAGADAAVTEQDDNGGRQRERGVFASGIHGGQAISL